MHIKKVLLTAGVALIASSTLFAQQAPAPTPPASGTPAPGTPQWSSRDMTYKGKGYDVLDSSYYPKKKLKQFKRYMDHQEAFPPMPRNQIEAGVGFGLYNVSGDVPSLMLWQKGGGGLHAHVRKAWGYVFSTRLQYIYGVAKNIDVQPTSTFDAPYTKFGYTPLQYGGPNPASKVYRSTRMESSQLNLDLIMNIYNISFHKARNQMSFYGYFGLGGLAYKTRVNALDANFEAYNYNTLVPDPKASNSKVRKDLQKKMDKTYESLADNANASTILDKKTLDFAPSIGAGVQFKLDKQWNISIEDRFTFPSDDYLDGTRFGTPIGNTPMVSQGSDGINYFSVGLNYNIKGQKKSVEPLYWMNPLDHAYNELSYPRHMQLPNPVLPDEDADGVTDQFDKCPKTPANVAVDGHGCPMDTDGDGVPDYKDKQLITPTECQPVDADGVGHCTCPADCIEKITHMKTGEGDEDDFNGDCPHIAGGSINFNGKTTLTSAMQAKLSTLAGQMKMDATCKVVIIGGGGDKRKEQRSWERVNSCIEYLTEKEGILRDRFIFRYGQGADEDVVKFRSAKAGESGSSTVPPPHPELR